MSAELLDLVRQVALKEFEAGLRQGQGNVAESQRLRREADELRQTVKTQLTAQESAMKDLYDSMVAVTQQRDNAQALADQRGARLTALEEDRRWALVEVDRLTALVRQRFGKVTG